MGSVCAGSRRGIDLAGVGLCRIEVAVGPGSGVKILNDPMLPAFRQSVRVGKQCYRDATDGVSKARLL